MPFCTQCGHQNPDGARFCSQCGSRLEAGAAPSGGPESPSESTATITFGGPVKEAELREERALGDADAAALPDLLAAAHQHLPGHPDLAAQIDVITTRADEIRRQPPRRAGE